MPITEFSLTSFLEVFADGNFCSSTSSKFVSKLSLVFLSHVQYTVHNHYKLVVVWPQAAIICFGCRVLELLPPSIKLSHQISCIRTVKLLSTAEAQPDNSEFHHRQSSKFKKDPAPVTCYSQSLCIPTGDQLSTGTQWNLFGRLVGHPPAAEKRRDRKLGCVVGASDTIMFINGYHRNQPIDRRMHP